MEVTFDKLFMLKIDAQKLESSVKTLEVIILDRQILLKAFLERFSLWHYTLVARPKIAEELFSTISAWSTGEKKVALSVHKQIVQSWRAFFSFDHHNFSQLNMTFFKQIKAGMRGWTPADLTGTIF